MLLRIHRPIFIDTLIEDIRKMKLLRILLYVVIGLLFTGFVYSSLIAVHRLVLEAPENFMIYGF